MSLRPFYLVLTGNLFDHYDSNLYAMMAPLLAPLFFPQSDPVVSLILAYGLLSVGIVTRPLGAFIFGHLARHRGPGRCLQLSLCGMALATGGMALLPTHAQIGGWAPMGLALLRGLQGFFGAGETAIAGLYALSFCPPAKHGWYGGIYQSSTVLGIFFASAIATAVSTLHGYAWCWRVPFLLGFITACTGVYLRAYATNWGILLPTSLHIPSLRESMRMLYVNRSLFGAVVAVSALSYVTYSIPFVFMNSFVPLVNSIPLSSMMFMGTSFLLLDILLCPILGKIADRFSLPGVMKTAAASLALGFIPMFLWLPYATSWTLVGMRMWVVLWGLVFLAPFYGWLAMVLPWKERFLLQGVGYQVGSEVFGRSLPAICMWLWYQTHSLWLLGTYITGFAIMAFLAVRWCLPVKIPHGLVHTLATFPPANEEIVRK
jgi:Sugar (and other) transporter